MVFLSVLAVLALGLFSSAPHANAAPEYVAIASGNYTDPSVWQGGNAPPVNQGGFTETIIIEAGVNVTLPIGDYATDFGSLFNYGILNVPLNAYWYNYGTFYNLGTLNTGNNGGLTYGLSDFAQYSTLYEYCGATIIGSLYFDGSNGAAQTYDVCSAAVSPTISTSLSATSIVAGGQVSDSATLSGAAVVAAGTVQYEYFASSSCSGSATLVGSPVPVGAATVPGSQSVTFASAGPYGWKAVYSGDFFDNPATSACEPLTVTNPPSLSLSPNFGLPGTTTTISGSGFIAGDQYSACLTTTLTSTSCTGPATSFFATISGNIPTSTTVSIPYGSPPFGTAAGNYYVVVSQSSVAVASFPFTVDALVPSVSLSPTFGLPGSSTTLSGSNYLPGVQYSVCLNTQSTSTQFCVPDASTSFTATVGGGIPTGTSLTIPYGSPPFGTAANTYDVIVYSGTTVVAYHAYTVDPLVPTLFLTSHFGTLGSSTTLSGSLYLPGAQYGACLSTTSVFGNADNCIGTATSFTGTVGGDIPSVTTVTVPYGSPPFGTPPLTYYLDVYSGTTVVAFTTYAVNPPPIPTLSLSVSSGPVGTQIILSGVNYLPSSDYSMCLDSFDASFQCAPGTTSQSFETSVGGDLAGPSPITFTVPTGLAAGEYYLLVGSGSDIVASQLFTVTSLEVTGLSASPNPTSGGQEVTATVSWSGGNPGYTVNLYYGASSSSCSSDSSLDGTEATAATSATFSVEPPVPNTGSLTTYFCATVTDSADISASSSTPYGITIYPYVTFPVVASSLQYIDSGQSALISTTTPFTGGYAAGGFTCQWLIGAPGFTNPTLPFGSTFPCTDGDLPTTSTGPLNLPTGDFSTFYNFELTFWENGSPSDVYFSNYVGTTVVPDLGSPGLTESPGGLSYATSVTVDYPTTVGLFPAWMGGVPDYAVNVYSSPTSSCSSSSTFVTSQMFNGYGPDISIGVTPGPFASYPTSIYYCDTVTDSSGAGPQTIASSAVEVTVYSPLQTPTITASATSIDIGQATTITSSSIAPSGDQPYTYEWCEIAPYFGSGSPYFNGLNPSGCDESPNPIITSGPSFTFTTSSGTKPSNPPSDPVADNWRFSVSISDSANYFVTSNTIEVVVDPALVASLTSPTNTLNADGVSTVTFTAEASGGSGVYTSYAWNVPAGLTVSSGCGTPDASCTVSSTIPGVYSVSYSVTDSNDNTVGSNVQGLDVINYNVTFQQTGIAAGVTWGVTVDGTDHTGTGSSVTVSGLTGSQTFTYDTPVTAPNAVYDCDTDTECAGTVTTTATISADYLLIMSNPTIQTSLSATTIDAGESVFDSATLTGTYGGAGGFVTFYYFASSSCSSSGVSVGIPITVSAGSVSGSLQFLATNSGRFGFEAVYSGDANNNGATSSCEPLMVDPPLTATITAPVQAPVGVQVTFDVRALEGFGIYYYFHHTDGGNTLIVSGCGQTDPSCTLVATGPGVTLITVTVNDSTGASVQVSSSLTAVPRATSESASCSSPIVVNSPFTCTATVTDTDLGTASTPQGTVAFASDGSATTTDSVCTLSQVSTGVSSCQVTYAPDLGKEGTHGFSANYAGDVDHQGSTTSFSLAYLARSTSTNLMCSPSTTPVNGPVTCTATVTDTAPPNAPLSLHGAVAFSAVSGLFSLPSCSVVPTSIGVSSCSVSFTPSPGSEGTLSIVASYSPDADHLASPATPFSLTITKAQSTVAVSCSPNPATIGSSTTCKAMVTGATPTGGVTFSTSTSTGVFTPNNGKCTLTSGACSVSYSDTTAGTITITAAYSGDGNNLGNSGTASLTESYLNCPQVTNTGGQNLKGDDLEYCNLGGYNLSGANLQGTNLMFTNLQNANLKGANLQKATLNGTDAAGANFQGTNLQSATMANAIITDGNFQGANLQKAVLAGDSASGSNFQGANLQSSVLSGGDFDHSSFVGANMQKADLSNGDFNYSDFTGANTQGVDATGATFVGATDAP